MTNMARKKTKNSKVVEVAEEAIEIYYTQNVTVNDNHGTIIFKQFGKPTPPPPGPPH